MFNGIALTNIIKLYYMIRTMHGVYVSYQFIAWVIISIYSGFCWILYYIPKPPLQIGYKDAYYEIDTEDYIEVKKY
tara:strand:- start:57 stop:284 length:228 start_codon:yes stop_codon:yes gene_type:complete